MTGASTIVDGRVALSLHEMLGASTAVRPPKSPPSEEDAPGNAKKSFQPYHAQSVPKPENLVANATKRATCGKPVTTMMLRNIPNKYTQNTLLQEIDDLGFSMAYDFFYLPMDVHNRSNVGYAFINMCTPRDAENFRAAFADHRFQRFQSRKISSVCVAHVQGLDENLRHFENRAVTHARNDQYRPIVLKGNVRVDFEEAVAEAKLKLQGGGARGPQKMPANAGYRPADGVSSVGGVRSIGGVPAPKWAPGALPPQPVAPPAHGEDANPRKGLEVAIRNLLTTLEPATPAATPAVPEAKPALVPPPGLGAASKSERGVGNDIEQLLSLRSMLVDRLLEKNDKIGPVDQGPAYVTLSPPSKLGNKYGNAGPQEYERSWTSSMFSDDRTTPRTNDLILGSSLDRMLPEESWSLL